MSEIPTHIDFRANVQQREAADAGFGAEGDGQVPGHARWRWWTSLARSAGRQLRQAGHDLRLHTLNHLDHYLLQLEERVTAAGGHVHWARDAEEANAIVLEIARSHDVQRAVKVKSMATEEIGLNHALIDAGIETLETDLGEFIIQLAGVGPSHIIVPAVHLTKEGIADLFREKLGVEAPAEPVQLAAIARARLRQAFLAADMGISGANFMVAETGTLVIVSNEGNGRMCTTLPPLHVAVVGIDKVVPDWESLNVMLKLLPRSATGQKMSAYTSFITGPRRTEGENGPTEFHLVLLDNGRSRILQDEIAARDAAVHPLRRVPQRLPGLQPRGRARLWLGLFRPDRRDLGHPAARRPDCRRSALCLVAVRRVRRVLPGEDPDCGDPAATAPPGGGRRRRGRRLPRRRPCALGLRPGGLVLGWPWLYELGTQMLKFLQKPFQKGRWLPGLAAAAGPLDDVAAAAGFWGQHPRLVARPYPGGAQTQPGAQDRLWCPGAWGRGLDPVAVDPEAKELTMINEFSP